MKTLAGFFMFGVLFFADFGYASAQSAAGSSKEVVEINNETIQPSITDTQQTIFHLERGIPTPPHIEKLLQDGKIKEALNEFEKFKVTQKKANPFHLLFCEMTLYQQAQIVDPTNASMYDQKAQDIKQLLISKYPNVSDTYILQIDNNTPDDKVIELATKAIELDSENISAYDSRGRTLYKLGKIKEACADFDKLPWKGNMPEYWQCKDLK